MIPTAVTRALNRNASSLWRAMTHDVLASFAQAAVGFGLLLIATLWAFVYFHVEEQKRLGRVGAERDMSNLARAFSEHVSRSVKEIDASLLLLRRAMQTQGERFKLGDYTNSSYFKNDLILQITSVDRDGYVIDSNLGAPADSMNLSDREHIRVQRERTEDLLYISMPLIGRISGRWSIQFTRKILGANGEYSGVLIASVNPESFSNYYSTFDINEGAITLLGRDGIVRARGSSTDENYLGMADLNLPSIQEAASRSGCFVKTSAFDSIETLFCAREVPGVDHFVVVTVPLERVDAEVNAEHKHISLLALILTFCCFPLIGTAIMRRYKLTKAMRELEVARRHAASVARDLRCALENMSDGIMLLDGDGDILVSNDQAFLHLGLNPALLDRPCNISEAINRVSAMEDLAAENLADLAHSMRLDNSPPFALCAGPGGKVLELRTHRLDDGRYVRTITDVTQTYRAGVLAARLRDDAQAAARARSSFLARMSHEIRTPLYAALGFTQLLSHEELSSNARNIADNIRDSSSHLIAIVNDILDLSTIEAGRLRMTISVVDIHALMARLEVIAKPLIAGKNVSLTIEVARNTPRWMKTDERRLLQILTNLLSNAIKFTDDGFVRVLVSTFNDQNGESQLRFEVEDTGCGLAPAAVPHLFEPFSRDESVSHKAGSGLGLAIVKELVTLMGGHITVKSAPDHGAVFTLEIPVAQAAETDLPPEETQKPIQSLNVLVADDTRSSLLLIRMLLEKRGHRVVTVSDGQAAVEASQAEWFNLVLLDIQMPLKNGFEAASEIRRHFAARASSHKRPLVSALSAQVLPEDQNKARAAGMDYMLRKPFEPHELDDLLAIAAAGIIEPESLSA